MQDVLVRLENTVSSFCVNTHLPVSQVTASNVIDHEIAIEISRPRFRKANIWEVVEEFYCFLLLIISPRIEEMFSDNITILPLYPLSK